MKFSLNWLQDYSKEPFSEVKKLEEIVTFNAFEIEEVTHFGDDTILDIKVLPNRAHDALGHRGMARDIATLVGTTFVDSNEYYKGEAVSSVVVPTIITEDKDACTRFMAVKIDEIEVVDSPLWLKERLQSIGQKSINSIVDITNYVQFSLNKPMHAYDAELVSGDTLIARYAKESEVLVTLDDKELTLNQKTLVIADKDKPLGLAGIKGGKFSGINAKTTSVILESANFNPTLIRKTAQKYNIRTDASKRFENEISDDLVEEGLRMTIALIQKLNPNAKVGNIVDVKNRPIDFYKLGITVTDVNKHLGTKYSQEEVEDVFKRSGFSYELQDGGEMVITVPHERLDIRIKEDLIEEVARIKGMSTIKGVLPKLNRVGVPHKRLYYENKIRSILYEQGFSEIMTYSFGNSGDIKIVKGLASDKEKLRSRLSDGVEKAFQMNMLNAPLLNIDIVKMYEFGNIFTQESEQRHLALVVDDGKKKTSFSDQVDMIISQIKRDLKVESIDFEITSTKPYVVEIDFDALITNLPEPVVYESLTGDQTQIMYQAVSPYPFIVRDIAMWVSSDTTWEDIKNLCSQVSNSLVYRIDLFDTFSKEIDGIQKTSYAFRFIFQSFEKTLTDEEVNVYMEAYYNLFKEKGYEVR